MNDFVREQSRRNIQPMGSEREEPMERNIQPMGRERATGTISALNFSFEIFFYVCGLLLSEIPMIDSLGGGGSTWLPPQRANGQ